MSELLKYSRYISKDEISLSLAHIDNAEQTQHNRIQSSLRYRYRLSSHNIKAPKFINEKEPYVTEIVCPICNKKLNFKMKLYQYYFLRARKEKAHIIDMLREKDERDEIKMNIITGVILGLLCTLFFWGMNTPLSIIGILFLIISIGVLIYTHSRLKKLKQKYRDYIVNGNLIVMNMDDYPQEVVNGMDSGPHTILFSAYVMDPKPVYGEKDHMLALDTKIGSTESIGQSTYTDLTDCRLTNEIRFSLSILDEKAIIPGEYY